jgi:hypothetical protein
LAAWSCPRQWQRSRNACRGIDTGSKVGGHRSRTNREGCCATRRNGRAAEELASYARRGERRQRALQQSQPHSRGSNEHGGRAPQEPNRAASPSVREHCSSICLPRSPLPPRPARTESPFASGAGQVARTYRSPNSLRRTLRAVDDEQRRVGIVCTSGPRPHSSQRTTARYRCGLATFSMDAAPSVSRLDGVHGLPIFLKFCGRSDESGSTHRREGKS